MPVTRIKNNQITDLTVNAAAKLQDYTITSAKIANNLTYNSDLTVTGNLTVQGNVTAIDTYDLVVEDPIIVLAKDQTGSPSLDIGFIGERGDETNIAFVWKEANDRFVTAFTSSLITNTTITITSVADLETGNLLATSGNISGTLLVTGNTTVGNIYFDPTSNIDAGNNIIGNVADPVANSDAATKAYVDSLTNTGFTISDGSNTQTVSGGDTVTFIGSANEIDIVVGATDNVTIGLTSNVTIADTLTVTNAANVGSLNSSGNVLAANVNANTNVTGITITASGNLVGNNAVITNDVSTATISASGNVLAANVNANTNVTGVTITASGNLVGNNAVITNDVSAATVSASGNVLAGNLNSNAAVTGVTITASGNLEGNNAVITNDVSAATVSASGNVLAGNLNSNTAVTGVTITASGNLEGNNAVVTNDVGAATVSASGNVLAGNLNSNAAVTGVTITASGNLEGNNAVITNDVSSATVSASGNIIAANVNANTNVTAVNVIASGNVDASNVNVTTALSVPTISVSGNVLAGNLNSNAAVTGVTITASGNLVGNNAVITNDVGATTITASGNILAANVNANTNVTGITITASGNLVGNNAVITNDVSTTTVSASGNVLAANLNANTNVTGVTITASGNLVGNNAVITNDVEATGNVSANNVTVTNAVSTATLDASGNAVVANLNANNFVTAVTVVASSNVDGANINTNSIVGTDIVITATSVDMNLTGNLILSGRYINELADPIASQDAATKQYVDDAVSSGIHIHAPVDVETPTALPAATYAQGGNTYTVTDTIAGNTVVFSTAANLQPNDQLWFSNSFEGIVGNLSYFVVSTPNTSAAVLSTQYNGTPVANITSNSGLTESVRVNPGIGATLTATANAALTVDGFSVSAGNRVLVYNQSTQYENGVYEVTDAGNVSAPWILTRATDVDQFVPDTNDGLDQGSYFYVKYGDTGAGESYVLTQPAGPFIIGYDAIEFTQFSASQVYTANAQAGIDLTGTVFSAKVDNDTTAFDVGGNIKVKDGANLVTPNIGNATGNSLTLTGNGLLSATTVEASGNVLAGNINSNAAVTAQSGEFSGNILAANVNANTNVTGITITASGNLEGNNAVIINDVSSATITASGNVLAGNLNSNAAVTGVTITASGNLVGNNAVVTNDVGTTTVSASGNIIAANVNANTNVTGLTITASGNLEGNNAVVINDVSSATITASGNVLAANVNANTNVTGVTITASGNIEGNNAVITNDVSAATVNASGNVLAANVNANTNVTGITITASGNLEGNNAVVTNDISAATGSFSGNIIAANVNANTNVTAVNVIASGNVDASNVNITTALVVPNLSVTGNVLAGNVNSNAAITGVTITASGNLEGNNAVVTNDVSAATITASGNISAANVNATSAITAIGNVTGGNLVTAANVSAAGAVFSGNVTASYYFGNGSQLSGIAVAEIANGTSNVRITSSGGNVQIGVNGTDDVAVFSTAGADITGYTTASGNVTGGNLVTSGLVSATTVTASGNISGANLAITVTSDLGNLRISGNDITNSADSEITINDGGADINFRVEGDTNQNLFIVDAGSDTVLISTATATTGAALKIGTTDSIMIPVGNIAQRPATGVTGMLRFNTTDDTLEFYDNDSWASVTGDFTIIVADEFTGDGSTVQFTLSEDSTTAATIVSINGVVQQPTTAYSVSGNVLTFTEAPLSSDVIDARVLTTTASITSIRNDSGNAVIEGSLTAAAFDITGDLIPTANVTYDLGSPSLRWRDGYFSGNSVTLGNIVLKNTSGNTIGFFAADGTTPATLDANVEVVGDAIESGTSNIGFASAGGNALVSVGGNANVGVFTATGLLVTGTVEATAGFVGLDASKISNGTSNISFASSGGNALVTVGGTANVGVFTSTGLVVTGSIEATAGFVGLDASKISNGTSEVNVSASNGNILANVGGSTIATLSSGGANVTGYITATGNVTGGNITTANIVIGADTITSANSTITIDPSAPGVSGVVVIAGNLTVQGTTTTFDSTTVTINDLQFNVANNAATAAAANDAGLGVGPVGSEYAKWIYQNSANVWSTAIGITASANITGGNLNTSGAVTGNGRALTSLSASNIDTGTLAQARLANASLTVNGTAITLGGSGTVTANTTNALTFSNGGAGGASGTTFNGGTAQTISYNSVGAPSTTGTNASGTWSISVTGSAGTAATVTTAAQPNITSVGTLSSLTVTGNVTGGNLITAGLVSLSSITKTGSNGVGNIGSSTSTFNTIFAKATSAQYADLAEMYSADQDIQPGTVVSFGGSAEVTVSMVDMDFRVAGIVSTNPSYIMNSALEGEHVIAVALTGRVPTRVTGRVRKGDMMVSNGDGTARAEAYPAMGSVLGKALEDHDGDQGTIEVVVGRL